MQLLLAEELSRSLPIDHIANDSVQDSAITMISSALVLDDANTETGGSEAEIALVQGESTSTVSPRQSPC